MSQKRAGGEIEKEVQPVQKKQKTGNEEETKPETEQIETKEEETKTKVEQAEEKKESKSETSEVTPKKQALPKRKVAILIAYCGIGYQGMQM